MNKKIKLSEIAHARSGDKGNNSNIGVIAKTQNDYEFLRQKLTADKVKSYFATICKGEVLRYEMPNILALNFILRDSLAGGGTTSLRTDSQGKCLAATLLELEIDC